MLTTGPGHVPPTFVRGLPAHTDGFTDEGPRRPRLAGGDHGLAEGPLGVGQTQRSRAHPVDGSTQLR